jgi:tetratricopeptide (TPR) repeat protein/DNA-binding winged helix-turn-helix (wHTH) protein
MELVPKIYRLEGGEIDTSQRCLRRNGAEQRLRQQAFDVLLYLVEHHRRLVGKDELLEHIWGDTAVTDNAIVQCIAEIRKALGDSPHQPRFVRTFPKVGYRFIGSVEGESVTFTPAGLQLPRAESTPNGVSPEQAVGPITSATATATPVDQIDPSPPERRASLEAAPSRMPDPTAVRAARRLVVATVAIALSMAVMLTVTAYLWNRHPPGSSREVTLPQLPGKRTVAVMYFDDHTGKTELSWLREGLADMLITDLARSDKLTVLGRQHLHLLLNRIGHHPEDRIELSEALDIAGQSHADMIVLGSFAQAGEQIRIDAQLYDTHSGQVVAADRILVNRPDDILAQVDILALKLATDLGVSSLDAGTRTALAEVTTDNLEAYRYYSLGVEKAQAFENAKGVQLLKKAIEHDPRFAMAYARIGFAYAVTDFVPEQGKPYLEKALQLSDRLSHRDKLYVTAWYAIARADYPQAIRIFKQIISEYPLEIEAYERLARLLHGEEQAQEAIRVLRSGLAIDPGSKDLYNVLGTNYLSLGRYKEAVAAMERYVELAPREPNAYDSLGMAYQQAGRYEDALSEYSRALALDPEFEPAIIHLGETYFQQGRYQDAIRQHRRYIQVAHSDVARAIGYSGIAQVWLRMGDFQKAEEAARNEARHAGGPAWTSLLIALERGDRGNIAKLKDALLNNKSPHPERGARSDLRTATFFRGYMELRGGHRASAISAFKEALRHQPPTSAMDFYEDCLANAYLELGDFDAAIREYERILRLNPDYPLVQYHLAQAYDRKGDVQRARSARQQFLVTWAKADADIPEVQAAKAALVSNPATAKLQ